MDGDAATCEERVAFISVLVSAVALSWMFTSGTSGGVGGHSTPSTGAGTFMCFSASPSVNGNLLSVGAGAETASNFSAFFSATVSRLRKWSMCCQMILPSVSSTLYDNGPVALTTLPFRHFDLAAKFFALMSSPGNSNLNGVLPS